MGTTLENGVYLPSEGERNCYAGLKTNWEILDQKVADVTALQQAVAGALHREIVESLPTTDINPNTIYMILSGTSATENVYNEYMYVNNAWELIGTSATDLTNYYTKGDVDGLLLLKANASDLTSHTGDTTIHVTTADKNKWNNQSVKNVVTNNQTIKSTGITRGTAPSSAQTFGIAFSDNNNKYIGNIYGLFATDMSTSVGLYAYKGSTTANSDNVSVRVGYDASGNAYTYAPTPATTDNSTQIATTAFVKAHDSNVVHNSGNETVGGIKTFTDMIPIDGDYLGNEASVNQRTNICLRSNRDTANKSCAYISRFRQNRSQGALQTGDLQWIGFDVLENEVRTNNVFSIQCTDWLNDVPQKVNFVSSAQSYSYGNSARKALFNDLNPGALGMPDLDNGIDISSYLTNLNKSLNTYTPPVNGWIEINLSRSALPKISMRCRQTNGLIHSTETSEFSSWGISFPVIGGKGISIYLYADSLNGAYFYPCLGNV